MTSAYLERPLRTFAQAAAERKRQRQRLRAAMARQGGPDMAARSSFPSGTEHLLWRRTTAECPIPRTNCPANATATGGDTT